MNSMFKILGALHFSTLLPAKGPENLLYVWQTV